MQFTRALQPRVEHLGGDREHDGGPQLRLHQRPRDGPGPRGGRMERRERGRHRGDLRQHARASGPPPGRWPPRARSTRERARGRRSRRRWLPHEQRLRASIPGGTWTAQGGARYRALQSHRDRAQHARASSSPAARPAPSARAHSRAPRCSRRARGRRSGSMAAARSCHAASALLDGTVLVSGGWSGPTELATAEIYNPAASTWASTGLMATARRFHTLAPRFPAAASSSRADFPRPRRPSALLGDVLVAFGRAAGTPDSATRRVC